MRNYEFRTWNTETKEMEYGTGHYSDSGIVMQYTGLKDKNGVKIFEGDLFRGKKDSPFHEVDELGFVNFHEWYGYSWGYWNLRSIEVLGNVHENPEIKGLGI